MRLLCWLRFHSWRNLKWGNARIGFHADCRECSRCGRFEIWVIYGWERRSRVDFDWKIRPAER